MGLGDIYVLMGRWVSCIDTVDLEILIEHWYIRNAVVVCAQLCLLPDIVVFEF
jgi:hypothetical protein